MVFSTTSILLSIIIVFLCVIYLSFKNTYRFWPKHHIPYIRPIFPFGNFRDSFKNKHFGFICKNLYDESKNKGIDYVGIYIFKRPAILIISPEFVKTILARDFNVFMDRGLYYNPKNDPLSANIFFHEGDQWRNLRKKLTPAFSTGKMKSMFITLLDVINQLINNIMDHKLNTDVDIKELMACFTTDVASSCIFGVESDCITNPNLEFRKIGKNLMKFTKREKIIQFIGMVFRDQARALGLRTFNKETTDFFNQLVHKIIGFRRENNIHRNDLMQIMIELMKQDYESDQGLSIDEIVANAFIFFFAGFETSSITLTFALYNLALNEQIQNEARKEVDTILKKHDNKITYDCITEFDLLERIILETLRQYPPVTTLHRISNQSYRLPNSSSEIPKGTYVIIPVYGIHHDENIYPEPDKFDPDRFLNENKAKRHPYAYLPFGEGQRICIGQRFGMMQILATLTILLKNFKIEICREKTEIPPKIDNTAITFAACDESIWLKFNKI